MASKPQMHLVTEAYHVSNRPEGAKHLKSLVPHLANDSYHDLVLWGLPCVFLSTTLIDGKLPYNSPYPSKAEHDSKHQRYVVPLDSFLYDKPFLLQSQTSAQTFILFLNSKRDGDVLEIISKKKEGIARKLNLEDNEFLKWCNGNWFANDYNSTKTYVNVITLAKIPCQFKDMVAKYGRPTLRTSVSTHDQVSTRMWYLHHFFRQKIETLETQIRFLETKLYKQEEEIHKLQKNNADQLKTISSLRKSGAKSASTKKEQEDAPEKRLRLSKL